jgi:anti-sigma factor RsiW
MEGWTTFRSCDRAREAASRALDSELSPFETRRLEAHLDVCAECSAFQAAVAATALELRAAPLVRLERPITLPRRRALRPVQGSAAAAMAAAAVLLLTITTPVDFNGDSSSRLAAPPTGAESRIVPDGETLPAEYVSRVDPTEDPIPE